MVAAVLDVWPPCFSALLRFSDVGPLLLLPSRATGLGLRSISRLRPLRWCALGCADGRMRAAVCGSPPERVVRVGRFCPAAPRPFVRLRPGPHWSDRLRRIDDGNVAPGI